MVEVDNLRSQISNSEWDLGMSPFRRGIRRLRRNRVALFSFWVLAALYSVAVLAPFLAPYHYDNEQREDTYHPPSSLHCRQPSGEWGLHVYRTSAHFDQYYRRIYQADEREVFPVRFFVKGDPYRILGVISGDRHLFGVEAPGRLYLLGADSRGRDLFSRLLYGAQFSLSIGLIGVTISFALGLLIGGFAGYVGGWADEGIMRLCEMMMMIPGFYLLLALRMSFPPEISSVQVYVVIVVIMSFIGWAGLARVIRGMVLSLRQRGFVQAAQLSGRSRLGIIVDHLLPNTLSYAIVAATLAVPGYILGESALSLLGLGIQDPYASWGTLLTEAMQLSQIRFHPWVLSPGVCIFITVMAYNFLGDGLRDAFDPRMN